MDFRSHFACLCMCAAVQTVPVRSISLVPVVILKSIWSFIMNWDIVKGTWKQFRGEVRAQWGELTDDHLDIIAGRRNALAGKIQETYGITGDEAEQQIRRFEQRG